MTTNSSGLPPDIAADVEAIKSGASALEDLRISLTGQTEDTDTQFRSAAGEFSDLIAWDIMSAASDELQLWEDTTRTFTYGAATLKQWAQDIEDYRSKRASIEADYEDNKNAPRGEGARILAAHQPIWDTLMDRADQANNSLMNGPSAAALERMVASGLLTGAQLSYFGDSFPGMHPDELPSQEDSPSTVNTWWTSLSDEEQEAAKEDHPELLRDLDGIPATVRDELNRDHLDDEIDRKEDEIAELEQENADRPLSPGARASEGVTDIKIADLQEELDVLNQLESDLDTSGTEFHHEEKFLLSLDTEGQGRAIVSAGNPDTADNVGTLVPGTTADWTKIVGEEGQLSRADRLAASAHDADEDSDHAVISWIGYDAPQGADAISSGKAEGAVEELSSFQEGLRATHQGSDPSHNTVIGHSYGSTVIGHTATSEQGLDADNYAFVGSPGVGTRYAEDLGIPVENVYSTEAENDGIGSTPPGIHDRVPSDEDFGATIFDSHPGSEGGAFPFGDAHSEYFRPDNYALVNLGSIIAGVEPSGGWTAE